MRRHLLGVLAWVKTSRRMGELEGNLLPWKALTEEWAERYPIWQARITAHAQLRNVAGRH